MSDTKLQGCESEPDKLLDDLESIKHLLDAEQIQQVDIPVLDELEETAPSTIVDDPSPPPPGISDDAFKRLLSDSWQESVDELFAGARSQIEANSAKWLPTDTEELADALKVRVDAAVRSWLDETLHANIDLLRQQMIRELSAALLDHIDLVTRRSISAKDD